MLEKTGNPVFLSLGVVFLLQATTEQSTFIGLLMYRFKCNPYLVSRAMYFAAIQTFIAKLASMLYTVYLWVNHLVHLDGVYYQSFNVVFVLSAAGLLGTQIYGVMVLAKIGQSVERKRRSTAEPEMRAAGNGGVEASDEKVRSPGVGDLPSSPLMEEGPDDGPEEEWTAGSYRTKEIKLGGTMV
ncbi:hypothetical protein BDK51DRAFT_26618 [Blyttiomyces helicus]|uniref:Uncharacterized protein n=1 Tax=Blyttiomyces helicus TaxID=388810 RepID=A0A4P9VT87_9FUNG|nr:hypothetical protein BDK51DRAFT_26618 [Blyttiomyces helicus]|eukprot:RKO82714.1 hypothetical protein BDK51DRAFT_26618 [Blyttiomyces helicus]